MKAKGANDMQANQSAAHKKETRNPPTILEYDGGLFFFFASTEYGVRVGCEWMLLLKAAFGSVQAGRAVVSRLG